MNKNRNKKVKEFSMETSLKTLKKIVSLFDNQPDDTPVSFEFIVGSLFPHVWDNVQQYGRDCYTQGYIQGQKDKVE